MIYLQYIEKLQKSQKIVNDLEIFKERIRPYIA